MLPAAEKPYNIGIPSPEVTMIRTIFFVIAALAVLSHATDATDAGSCPQTHRGSGPDCGFAKLSANPGVTVVTDEKEVSKGFGDDIGKQISGKLDFRKEALVHVSWGSSGPPFGELKYETKDTKDGKAITFFIQEPKVAMRGQAYRLGQ